VALRIVHVLFVAPSTAIFTDGFFFHWVAHFVADGHGYVNPADQLFHGHTVATAGHPPLYTYALAGADKLGITSDEAQRSLGCLFGAGTIAAVGVLGRRVRGDRVGLLAALVAALNPLLIAADGALMSETLYGLLIALALIAAYRVRDAPSPARAALLGLAVGLCALTRAEALLLLPLLVLPGCWRRWRLAGVALVASLVVVAPWTIRNWSAFGRPVLISTNDGITLAGSNCGATYAGRDLGSFRPDCIGPVAFPANEARQAARYRSNAVSYAGHRAGRVPLVVAVRVLRLWGLYQPTRLANDSQNRRRAMQVAGILVSYVLLPFVLFGAVTLRRLREPLSVLAAPIVLVTLTAALTYGGLRLRHAAEIPLMVLAAVGLVTLWERRMLR
jgi:4-amino-4-deoxy-L-arabinose transferase-like glycosyltransferase